MPLKIRGETRGNKINEERERERGARVCTEIGIENWGEGRGLFHSVGRSDSKDPQSRPVARNFDGVIAN